MAAEVQARDRLLAGVAALRQADRALDEAGLGREDALVDLTAPGRCPGLDAPKLELGATERRLESHVENLDRRLAVLVGRDPGDPAAEDERRGVLLELDLGLGGEA
jgi:hypothetical protein